MKKYYLFAAMLLALLLIPACAKNERTYTNKSFDFSVPYPSSYAIKEFKTGGMQTGAELKSTTGVIDIRMGGAGTDYEKMPFDKYVRIAAASEIQNYDKLVSIESFTTDSGIKGYRTRWRVLKTIPPDEWVKGMTPETYVSGPIYYFPPKAMKFIYAQPVKTIQLSCYPFKENDKTVERELETIAKGLH